MIFSPTQCKISDFWLLRWNFYFDRLLLLEVYKDSTKNSMEEICPMISKSGAKFEKKKVEKLIFCFKNDKSLVNFDWSTKKSKKFACWLVSFVQSIKCLTSKSTEELYFTTLQSHAKFEEKIDLWFGKWHEECGKFSSEHLKVSKLVFSWDPFVQSRKCMSYKLTEEL